MGEAVRKLSVVTVIVAAVSLRCSLLLLHSFTAELVVVGDVLVGTERSQEEGVLSEE